jgi:hypothetical protein
VLVQVDQLTNALYEGEAEEEEAAECKKPQRHAVSRRLSAAEEADCIEEGQQEHIDQLTMLEPD